MFHILLHGWVGRVLLGWVFENMTGVLPLHRLYETNNLIAFYHPTPVYPVHILLVPKRAVADLNELSGSEDGFEFSFLQDVLACVQSLVMELGLDKPGWRLIVNGGGYQDLPQLHFHLVSG